MERVPAQKRIVFFLLEPVRCPWALLVARGHVTRNRFAQGFRFGALENDNFLRHKIDNYSLLSTGAAASSSVSLSLPSSSVKPKSEVTDWRTRDRKSTRLNSSH